MFKAKSLKSAPAVTLKSMIGSLESLARQTKFLVRSPRKISPEGFLLSLLKSVCSGQASLNQVAMFIGRCDVDSPSRQAVHKRLGKPSGRFLQAVLDKLLHSKCLPQSRRATTVFARILVEDSSQLKTHRANHESYPGMGNGSGATAGSKIDSCIDLMGSQSILAKQTAARVQDRTLGPKLMEYVQANDLVLRDMGYFSLKDFATIEAKNAFWLSRLHSLVHATLPNGETLEKLLKSTRLCQLDIEVRLGETGHKARLIAVRVDDEVCAERRRRRRAKSKKQGHTPRKESLLRDEWSIYVTNIPSKNLSADSIVRLYATRWSIEIQFRSWKQSTKMGAALNRITNRHHLEALILAAMIFQVLSLRITRELQPRSKIQLSIEKTSDWLTGQILSISSMTSAFSNDLRHLCHDRRKRILLRESLETILAQS